MNKNAYLLLVSLALVAQGLVTATYPNIQNLRVTGISYENQCLVVSGQLKIYFTGVKGIYPNVTNEFVYFNAFWLHQVGHSYQGYSLVGVKWVLLEHHGDYDLLGFKVAIR